MTSPKHAVIHINFQPTIITFDARPIWTALNQAEQRGALPTSTSADIQQRFGNAALHLATRHGLMTTALNNLKDRLKNVYDLVPDPWSIQVHQGYRTITGPQADQARDQVLLAIDTFLYEYRAFLDLLSTFTYGILNGINRAPADQQTLTNGDTITISTNGKLRRHDFLRYLADTLGVTGSWYAFLNVHRNFFTHQGAPYCAIEAQGTVPPTFDLLVMKQNIHDFTTADPKDYFRISDCQQILTGIRQLSSATQLHLITTTDRL